MVYALRVRDLFAVAIQRLTQRGQLQRHLQRAYTVVYGIRPPAQCVEQLEVGPHGGIRAVDIGNVLAQIVDADQPARIPQCGSAVQHTVQRRARYEPVYHLTGNR